jgi:hypothetical protein
MPPTESRLSPRRHEPGDRHAPLATLDAFACNSRSDVLGFVLGLGLQREESAELLLNLRTVWSRLPEQGQNLIVIFARGSLTEASTAQPLIQLINGTNVSYLSCSCTGRRPVGG